MSQTEPQFRNGSGDGVAAFGDTLGKQSPLQFKVNHQAPPGPKREPPKTGSVAHDPFDDSFLNHVVMLLKKHGIAASKIIFMAGTAAATLYAGLSFSAWTVRLMVWGCGFLLECNFAYSWVMTGSDKLAGAQVHIIRRVFKTASIVMMGDLITMLLDHQAGIHELFIFWTSGVQPAAAVFLMWQLYRLKESHPETIAAQKIRDLQARARAMAILDKANEHRLQLAEREHERALEWAALEKRHYHGMRFVASRWYDRQIKKATKQAVGQGIDGAALKMKNLPGLLSIGGVAKQKPTTGKKAPRRWFGRK